jgi:hypothetical protein
MLRHQLNYVEVSGCQTLDLSSCSNLPMPTCSLVLSARSLVKGGGWQTSVEDSICCCVPTSLAGTSNYWSHLWTYHRLVLYELKQRDGALNPAGEAAMVKLKEGLSNMTTGTQVNPGISGEQFLSPNLSSDQKETMDHIVTEWIVDEDQCFNAVSTPGFRAMMSTATNCNYDGSYHTTVQGPCGGHGDGGQGGVHSVPQTATSRQYPRRAVGACACTCSLGLVPCAFACT